jgi:fused signal recognition particle receptor
VAERICHELKNKLQGTQVKRFGGRREVATEVLREILMEVLEPDQEVDLLKIVERKERQGLPAVMLFVGFNGVGKTVTLAKVTKMLLKQGHSVVLACSDTFRAGAIEQLSGHAERLKVRMIKRPYGSDPASVAFDAVEHAKAHKINAVLIDTAGRAETSRNLMEELKKIKQVIEPDLSILVVDALTGNAVANQAEEFNNYVGIDAIIVAKADADVKGGACVSATYVVKKPILFIGTGPSYDDLEKFTPRMFVDLILSGRD